MSTARSHLSHALHPADALARHGGDLATARMRFPEAQEPWIDLSTGINPVGYPVGEIASAAWQRLPDAAALEGLERSARPCYRLPPRAGLVAAAGTQALLHVLPRIRPARRVAVVRFGYQEHPAVWRAAGAEVFVTDELGQALMADVVVVTNPNNPDGHVTAPGHLLDAAHHLAERGGTLLVDEAFADVLPPDASLVPRLPPRGVLVLRSFGKFFGLAGLRLGFAMGDPTLCAALRRELGPWAVAGPALVVGRRALEDAAWQARTRTRLAAAAARLDAVLTRAGLVVVGGTHLFRLATHRDATALLERLGRAAILVRPFATQPTWLRFGLPADEREWERLAAALSLA